MNRPLSFPALLGQGWQAMRFEPFREGIEICTLMAGEPGLALLRYQPGASAPLHLHQGHETIVVLEGEQADENGRYPQGTVIVNPPGTRHSVWSEPGCVVLIQWNLPVRFIDPSTGEVD